jgi:long-subunit fatty acid transport protein
VALYRHELANFEAGFKTQGAFLSDTLRLNPAINSLDLKIVNLGLSFAVEVNDALSLGIGLSSYDFHLISRTDRFKTIGLLDAGEGGPHGPPLYDTANLADSQSQRGEDRTIGFNGGFRWQIRDGWTLGGAYRQGPKFDLEASRTTPKAPATDVTRPARFDTPDFAGLGLAIQPNEKVTVTLDFNRVQYSDLTKSFTAIVLGQGNLELTPEELRRFRADDVTEIHLGFERAFHFRFSEVFARVGVWSDPDHRIRYEGTELNTRSLFHPGKDEIHYSAGFGFSRENLEVDAAVDLSKRVNTISLSTVFRF